MTSSHDHQHSAEWTPSSSGVPARGPALKGRAAPVAVRVTTALPVA